MLKKLLLGSATAMVVAVGAAAQSNVPDPLYSWTGCYIGAHLGGGGLDSSWTGNIDGPGIGAVYGGQAGCNSQVRQFVIGIEGELWASSINAQAVDNTSSYGGTFYNTAQAKNVFDGTIALRLGYALDRSLFYGKIGADVGRFNFTENNSSYCSGCINYNNSMNTSATVPGLLLGAGFEYAFLNNWTAKIEYNYIAFGTPTLNYQQLYSFSCVGVGCAYTESVAQTFGQTQQIVKVGLNYKFSSWSGKFSFGGP